MRVFSTFGSLPVVGVGALIFLNANLPAFAQVPDPGSEGKFKLPWLKTMSEAMQKAREEKKPILIDVTTDWCGWSKKMERETFADLNVQKDLRGFILVRLNPEASENNQKIADSYGVDGYPTLIIANYQGEEVAESGYATAKNFLTFLQRYQPAFKGNPLGYKKVQLDANDPLLKAAQRIPAPNSRPTSVGSFVVLDESTVTIQPDGSSRQMIRTATYVSDPDKQGLPRARGSYVSSREKLKFQSVRILDTNGAGREVDVKLAKDENGYSNENVYWDVHTLSLKVPRLKAGQILDVIEERESQPIIPNQISYRWMTGLGILLTSDLTLTFPASLKLQKRAARCKDEVKETKNSDGTVTWRLITSSRKPYEPALFSPPPNEIWEGYDFYTPCTKDTIAAWFNNLCKGRDQLPVSAAQKVASLKQSSTNQTVLLQAISDWVTHDVRYVSVDFGAASHQPHRVSETLTNGYGDCKDQSLLVQSLCRQAGLPAAVVLLDARGEDADTQYPSIEHFNHCIVEAVADGHTYYVDPAAGHSKVGEVPAAYAGVKALKISGAAGTIVTLPAYQPHTDEASSKTLVHLNPNGSATVTESVSLTGEAGAKMREYTKKTTPEKVREHLEASFKKSGRKLLDFYMTGTNAPGTKYETRMTYTVPRFGSSTSGGLAFKMSEGRNDNWIEALDLPRTQPFRFRASDASTRVFTVELPTGAVLRGQPKDLEIATAFMKATRKVASQNNEVSVVESSQFLDAHLDANESKRVYSAFRKLHDHSDYTYIVEMPPEQLSAGQ